MVACHICLYSGRFRRSRGQIEAKQSKHAHGCENALEELDGKYNGGVLRQGDSKRHH